MLPSLRAFASQRASLVRVGRRRVFSVGTPHGPAPATWPGGPECAVNVQHAVAGVHCSWPENRSEFEPGCHIDVGASRQVWNYGGIPLRAFTSTVASPTHMPDPLRTAQWLQFWLQFTGVRGMPGGFILPVQDT